MKGSINLMTVVCAIQKKKREITNKQKNNKFIIDYVILTQFYGEVIFD
jgi:hypothetical protein